MSEDELNEDDADVRGVFERSYQHISNSDIVAELKARLDEGSLKEALLVDLSTCRLYGEFGAEPRQKLSAEAVFKCVFPLFDANPDCDEFKVVTDMLFELQDEQFSALRDAVKYETIAALRSLVKRLDAIAESEKSDD